MPTKGLVMFLNGIFRKDLHAKSIRPLARLRSKQIWEEGWCLCWVRRSHSGRQSLEGWVQVSREYRQRIAERLHQFSPLLYRQLAPRVKVFDVVVGELVIPFDLMAMFGAHQAQARLATQRYPWNESEKSFGSLSGR